MESAAPVKATEEDLPHTANASQMKQTPVSAPGSGLVTPANGVVDAVGLDRSQRRRGIRDGAGTRDDTQFKRRLIQHRQKDMLFELRADGTYDMMEMTVRDACNYVQGKRRLETPSQVSGTGS